MAVNGDKTVGDALAEVRITDVRSVNGYQSPQEKTTFSSGILTPAVAATSTQTSDLCCTVCERGNHAAMFNIFKCFCLAQRLFRAAKLFQFRRCHLRSSYVCEQCVERLEVIEELEVLKREFACNFLGRCTVEPLSANTPNLSLSRSTTRKLGVVSEDEMDSVICTPKAAQEPEVMFISRLKRHLSFVTDNARDSTAMAMKNNEQNPVSKPWRVDVLNSPSELGGMNNMNLAALPTIRQLFTSHGQRRYWLLPPKSLEGSPIRMKKRRFGELVKYLKQQTASNALLASAKQIHGMDAKRLKIMQKASEDEQHPNNESVAQEDKTQQLQEDEETKDKKVADGNVTEPDCDVVKVSATCETSKPKPKAFMSGELQIASSDDESVVVIDGDDGRESDDSGDPIFNLRDTNMIENVVESFLCIGDDEIQQSVKMNAKVLGKIRDPESPNDGCGAALPSSRVPVDTLSAMKLLQPPKPTVKTKRVAPMIRLIAPKALLAAASTATAINSVQPMTTISQNVVVSMPNAMVGSSSMKTSTPIMVFTSVGSNGNVSTAPIMTTTKPSASQQLTFLANHANQSLMLVGGVRVSTSALAYVTPSLLTLPLSSIASKGPSASSGPTN